MSCTEWLVFEGISAFILELTVQLILILRLYAMYSGTRHIQRILLVPFAVEVCVMATTLGVSIPRIMTTPDCIEASLPIEMAVYCITAIAYECLLLYLTVSRYFYARRNGWGNIPLMTILIRDGVWGFALVFGNAVLSLLEMATS
ncbi:hypothetical protein WOLCODRAFT_90552 [Wolfiporia cocos MD-104 SS10]|uniref:Uncharacterized protein n=1 Tax=Wolfiporia cocos (strain MD-104) TaxID=742152 RepID=A0A2H3K473_WOLCO|nr:hypothetical protein WOLCODRAFT_90552 [Wolfiporia cocos MD-104 SS10]